MKDWVCRLFLFSGLTRLAAWMNRKQVVILCYHGVTASPVRKAEDPKGLHVRRERFLRQLDYLRGHYRVISLDEYLAARAESKPIAPYTAVVTFDDGFRNFLTVAAPALDAASLPATLFLITNRLSGEGATSGQAWSPQDDSAYLTENEVGLLARYPRIRLGSHTQSHAKLTQLPLEAAVEEIRGSYARLKRYAEQQGALALAYPFGYASPEIALEAKRAGFSAALTTDAGANDATTDLYGLRRLLIGDADTVAVFAARLSGIFWMMKRLLGSH